MIPRGTGVDFVRTFGIPSGLDGAVESRSAGRTREIDAGRVGYRAWSGEPGEAWFFNVAGVGMSGAVAKRTNESSKALGGKVSYLWSTLAVFARWRNTEVQRAPSTASSAAGGCTRWSSRTAATSAAG